MASISELESRRAAYLAAELRILGSQEYTVGDGSTSRRNRRADLEQVRQALAEIDAQIAQLQALASGGRRVLYIQ